MSEPLKVGDRVRYSEWWLSERFRHCGPQSMGTPFGRRGTVTTAPDADGLVRVRWDDHRQNEDGLLFAAELQRADG